MHSLLRAAAVGLAIAIAFSSFVGVLSHLVLPNWQEILDGRSRDELGLLRPAYPDPPTIASSVTYFVGQFWWTGAFLGLLFGALSRLARPGRWFTPRRYRRAVELFVGCAVLIAGAFGMSIYIAMRNEWMSPPDGRYGAPLPEAAAALGILAWYVSSGLLVWVASLVLCAWVLVSVLGQRLFGGRSPGTVESQAQAFNGATSSSKPVGWAPDIE